MTVHLPTLNATLNGLAGIFLFCGWRAIRSGKRNMHMRWMLGALAASSLFLCSYLYYHFSGAGITHYQKDGILRIVYFTILSTHTPLAAIIVPFSIAAVWHAARRNFASHVKITRRLLPVWMYVSVTGVLIYLMLYIF